MFCESNNAADKAYHNRSRFAPFSFKYDANINNINNNSCT